MLWQSEGDLFLKRSKLERANTLGVVDWEERATVSGFAGMFTWRRRARRGPHVAGERAARTWRWACIGARGHWLLQSCFDTPRERSRHLTRVPETATIECVRGDRAGACSRCWPARRPLDRFGYIDMGTDPARPAWCEHSLPHLELCFKQPSAPISDKPPDSHNQRNVPTCSPPQGTLLQVFIDVLFSMRLCREFYAAFSNNMSRMFLWKYWSEIEKPELIIINIMITESKTGSKRTRFESQEWKRFKIIFKFRKKF